MIHMIQELAGQTHRTYHVTAQVRLHCFPETTVQNFLDSGI
jgi:hypothetical protein